MGRPPIGKAAMSDAERQRRRRAKFAKPDKPEPDVAASPLLKKDQARVDAEIRRRMKTLEDNFEDRVNAKMREHVAGVWLPHMQKKLDDADEIVKSRKGVMTDAEFKTISMCVHPDTGNHVEAVKRNEAFRILQKHRLALIAEKENPQRGRPLPTSAELWELVKARDARRAKR